MKNYISVAETSIKWTFSTPRACTLCADGRIPGVIFFVGVWTISQDTEKPVDARIKSGKYIDFVEKYHKNLNCTKFIRKGI
ncbi:MAG: DNA-binding protein [Clostridiales bacterium]